MKSIFKETLHNSNEEQFDYKNNLDLNDEEPILNTQDILNIKNKIITMSKNDHIEIFKLLKKNKIKYTENKNGIFINLTKIDNRILLNLKNFIEFSIYNNSNLDKENLLRKNLRDAIEQDNHLYENKNEIQSINETLNLDTTTNLNEKEIINETKILDENKVVKKLIKNKNNTQLNNIKVYKNTDNKVENKIKYNNTTINLTNTNLFS